MNKDNSLGGLFEYYLDCLFDYWIPLGFLCLYGWLLAKGVRFIYAVLFVE